MKIPDPRKLYGSEYPAVAVFDGERMPLLNETRFSGTFHSAERNVSSRISRFMDASTVITAKELRQEWAGWKEDERVDFCQASYPLESQDDYPEMLRFIMQHSGPPVWASIAMQVASTLPRNEAFEILVRALRSTEIGKSRNITQGIAITEHSEAGAILRRHLSAVWAHPALWEAADFINWVACDATTCISLLVKLGAPPKDFDEQVRQLSAHVCSRNREICRNNLSRHYSWVSDGG